MKKWLLLILLAGGAGAAVWWFNRPERQSTELVLLGNVDLRQADVAFNNNERIAAVMVKEGDRVQPGQVLARLNTSRLEPQVEQAAAQVAAQRSAVDRLHHGNRPEEIAQARANVDSAKADAANAQAKFNRDQKLFENSRGGALSQQDLDNSKAALAVAEAHLAVEQKALELAVIGPRKEDIAEAEARLRGNEAQLVFLKQQLADAELHAPASAVVRSRLMEPGEMASPQRPVFSLALVDPKWVRAYVSEPDLGHVRPGMTADVQVDSFPNRTFSGWVGFISPVAEFTPKTVQTEELRTSLVFEVRVFVNDPDDDLRLGMPATVYLGERQPPQPSPMVSPAAPRGPKPISAAELPKEQSRPRAKASQERR